MAAKKNFLFAGLNFGLKTFNNLIVFGILARIIGLASFGLISYLIALITFVATISVFGYRMMIVKEVAVNKQLVDVEYLLSKVVVVTVVYSVTMIGVGCYIGFYVDSNIAVEASILFCAASLFFALSNFLLAFFHAINKFYLETISLAFFSVILLVGLYFTWQTHHMRYFAAAYGFGGVVMFLMSAGFFWKNYKLQLTSKVRRLNWSKVQGDFWSAAPFAVISIGDIMFNTIDSIIVEAYLPKEELGIYMGILKIVLGLCLFSAVAYSAALPTISRILAHPTRSGLNLLFKMQGGLMLIGLVACGLYFLLDDLLISLFLGPDFSGLSTYNVVDFTDEVVLFAFSRYCIIIPAIFLIAGGNHSARAIILLMVLLISFIAYLCLIPTYGLVAAMRICAGANITLLILYLLKSYCFYQKLKIE